MMICLGIAGFVLFFLSDINDAWLHRTGLRWSFPVGAVFLTLALIYECAIHPAPSPAWWLRMGFSLLAVLGLLLLVLALIIDVPVAPSYGGPGQRRPLSRRGLYAACRHPGIGAFFLLCLGLWLAVGLPWQIAALYCALDFLLAVFEDRYVFPLLVEGYGVYQQDTPFLVPRFTGWQACLKDYRQRTGAR